MEVLSCLLPQFQTVTSRNENHDCESCQFVSPSIMKIYM